MSKQAITYELKKQVDDGDAKSSSLGTYTNQNHLLMFAANCVLIMDVGSQAMGRMVIFSDFNMSMF